MKGLTSPEAVLILPVAIMFDVIGFVIFALGTWFGLDDYGILDTIASVIMGGWMLFRYSFIGSEGGMKVEEENKEEGEKQPIELPQRETKKPERPMPEKNLPETRNLKGGSAKTPKGAAKQQVQNLSKKALKRFGLTFLTELIPFVGGLVPAWTIMVYKEMKD